MAELLEPFAGLSAPLVAERLMTRFGSLGRAMEAAPEQHASLHSEDADVLRKLRAARELAAVAAREELARERIRPTGQRFQRYLLERLGSLSSEAVHGTFLDSRQRYLADEVLAGGALQGAELRGRHLVQRALDLGASGVILAHNHPSGSSEPSAEDVASTRRLASLLASLEIELVDHLVVGRDSVTSLRQGGLM